ncbi:MAG: hypothetical protein LUQ22_08805 [Methanotrichaceae archaeon]|nr:hypothetical protein [Methanotrichaceae archaeon]
MMERSRGRNNELDKRGLPKAIDRIEGSGISRVVYLIIETSIYYDVWGGHALGLIVSDIDSGIHEPGTKPLTVERPFIGMS